MHQREKFDEEDRNIFHKYFDIRLFISLGAAIMPVVIPLFVWGMSVESRLVVQQEQIRMISDDQRRQDERYTSMVASLREDLKEMNRKIDRLIENMNQGARK